MRSRSSADRVANPLSVPARSPPTSLGGDFYESSSYIISRTMSLSRRHAEAQHRQAHQDLDELAGQLAEGEIDPATAELLRAVYRRELEEAETAIATAADDEEKSTGFRVSRRLVAVLAVVVMAAAVAVSVGGFFRIRAPGAPITGGFEGVARFGFDQGADGGFDPSAYSDEALEAVVAANADNPEIAGMRIALADRYFSRGDYQAAFPHYQAVLEVDPPPPPVLLGTALSRLGWMTYQGNGEFDLALGLFDRALQLRPGDPYPTYLKALVLWCGAGETDQAVRLLRDVLASGGIAQEVRATVEADLASAAGGEPCR